MPSFDLPEGVSLVEGPNGLRLRGLKHLVADAAERLRVLRDKPDGYRVHLGEWTLAVTEYVPDRPEPRVVAMPGHAWNIAASVLRDAAFGEHEHGNPFDFRDVGYLAPPADPDIGIDVTGDAIDGPPPFDPPADPQ
jgi:hypothetical protein